MWCLNARSIERLGKYCFLGIFDLISFMTFFSSKSLLEVLLIKVSLLVDHTFSFSWLIKRVLQMVWKYMVLAMQNTKNFIFHPHSCLLLSICLFPATVTNCLASYASKFTFSSCLVNISDYLFFYYRQGFHYLIFSHCCRLFLPKHFARKLHLIYVKLVRKR
jgi:hypothetical protein